ncbi:hypothetical protein CDL15_Pgr027384 [Punica granatum]|uniref:Uncharacterized protein n=1 Tax=Punica granatum TaxID=22663 RepID=A0A218Y0P7_PUNGR|nr:hypothetical protein CDL15_Pgr027384 [Punica granatum]
MVPVGLLSFATSVCGDVSGIPAEDGRTRAPSLCPVPDCGLHEHAAIYPRSRQIFVGYLSIVSLISMFASPLLNIKLVPNGVGTLLGISQLSLYFYYRSVSAEGEWRVPLMRSYA